MKDIEIHSVKATEVTIPRTKTLYYVANWYNGMLMSSAPWENKADAEKAAHQKSQYSTNVAIYKFEIDVPNFENNETV